MVCRLKDCRRLATRYDKLAAIICWLWVLALAWLNLPLVILIDNGCDDGAADR